VGVEASPIACACFMASGCFSTTVFSGLMPVANPRIRFSPSGVIHSGARREADAGQNLQRYLALEARQACTRSELGGPAGNGITHPRADLGTS
jgi:hypothetical protein